MPRKSYLIVAITIIFALALSLGFSNVVTAKVSEQLPSKAIQVYDADIVAPDVQFLYLTSFETEGYTHVYIMAKATGSFAGIYYLRVYAYENNLGVRVLPEPSGEPFIALNGDESRPDYGTGVSPKWEIYGQSIDLYIKASGDLGIIFSGHLTITVYLMN